MILYMWRQKYCTSEQIHETQTHRQRGQACGCQGWGWERLGVCDWQRPTIIYRIDKQGQDCRAEGASHRGKERGIWGYSPGTKGHHFTIRTNQTILLYLKLIHCLASFLSLKLEGVKKKIKSINHINKCWITVFSDYEMLLLLLRATFTLYKWILTRNPL